MRKSTNFVLVSLASLLLVTIIAQNALAQDTTVGDNQKQANAPKAIPSWIDNNFKWYGEGKIGQGDLLNSLTFMLDNGLMHLSDKAAQEMKNLREENKKMHEMIGQYKETDLDFVSRSAETSDVNDQALHHLRKSYDLNPNLQTKVVQYDDKHEKWIDVLSIDWGGTSEAGDPDRPIIIGRMSAQDATSDMVLKGSKIKENFVDTTRQTPKTDFGSVMKTGVGKEGNSLEERIFELLQKIKTEKQGEIEEKLKEKTSSDTPNLSISKLPSMAIKPEMARLVQDNCAMVVALSSEVSVLVEEIEFASKLLDDLKTQISASTTQESKDLLRKQISSLEAKLGILIDRVERTQQKITELTSRVKQTPEVNCNGYSDMETLKLQTKMDQMSKTISTLSSIMKNLHDTAKNAINNVR